MTRFPAPNVFEIRAYEIGYAYDMVQVLLDMPEGAFASLKKDPDAFGREMRLAAAVKWFELGEVSQGRAAEIAGLSRSEFLTALGRYKVSPFQYSAIEALEEAERG